MIGTIRRAVACAVIATCAASTAFALEVTINAPDEVADDLRIGSLTASLVNGTEAGEPASGIEVLSAAQADYGRLIGVLYEKGYFAPTISIQVEGREVSSLSAVAAPPTIPRVVITVDPGAVFTFGNMSIAPEAPTFDPVSGLMPGETARVSILRAGTAAQIAGWRQAGHAKAAVADQQITARHPDKTLSATVTLDPGPRLRFGELIIQSESAVREKRIREIIGWESGEVFDPDHLDDVKSRMRRTGTFAAVTLTEAEEPNPDGTLDVTATISDQLPRRYSFGAEYSTLDGLSVTALWLHRNIFGGAERLQIDGEISGAGGQTGGEDYRLTALLARPATFRTDLEAFVLAEIEQVDDPNLFSRTARIEGGGTYFASDTRQYTYGIGFRRSLTRDDLGERSYTIFTIPLSATFDHRDEPLNATSGYYARLGLTPFLNISGTENGVVTTLDLRTYRKVGDRVTLAVRGVLGSVSGPDITLAPADFLFFSGGSDSVRGQEYESLGVELSPGVIIGGRSYVGLSGEVR
ncbi:MAG: BamA/TamA family outer membrane protein, partial [Pseudomonadota bacterium]